MRWICSSNCFCFNENSIFVSTNERSRYWLDLNRIQMNINASVRGKQNGLAHFFYHGLIESSRLLNFWETTHWNADVYQIKAGRIGRFGSHRNFRSLILWSQKSDEAIPKSKSQKYLFRMADTMKWNRRKMKNWHFVYLSQKSRQSTNLQNWTKYSSHSKCIRILIEPRLNPVEYSINSNAGNWSSTILITRNGLRHEWIGPRVSRWDIIVDTHLIHACIYLIRFECKTTVIIVREHFRAQKNYSTLQLSNRAQ